MEYWNTGIMEYWVPPGHYSPGWTITLLAGIGFEKLIPDGISWLYKKVKDNNPFIIKQLNNSNTLYHFEKLVCRIYYLKRNVLQENRVFKEELIRILDIFNRSRITD